MVPRVLSRKSSADFYNVSNPFLHCLVHFVLILHWHQYFRVLKLYQPVYKKVQIRYFGEHPDEFNPKLSIVSREGVNAIAALDHLVISVRSQMGERECSMLRISLAHDVF